MSFGSKRVVSWGVLAFLAAACAPGDAVFEQRRQAISEWTGSLTTARWNHTATLLNNGKVLVAGGEISSQIFSSAELYDPATGTWSATGAMTARRSHHTAVLLSDGRVLVAGGYNTAPGYAQVLASAEIYDPATGTWTATGSMRFPRYMHAAVGLADGRVMAVGGFRSINTTEQRSSETYDPATGTWSDVPVVMTSTRRSHSAFRLSDGRVMVVGGQAWNGSTDTSTSVEIFDPVNLLWNTRGWLQSSRVNGRAVLLDGDRVLVVGGSSSASTAEIFDPVLGYSNSAGFLGQGRAFHTLTRFDSGRVLAVGGSSGSPVSTTATIESYDIAAGTWSTVAAMHTPRDAHTATLLPGPTPKLLVAAGTAQQSGAFATAELYSDGADVTPPTTSMTYPLAGYTLSQTPTLSANASDNMGVTRVEFYRDSVLLGSSTGPYYMLSWNTTTVPNGSYTLSTKAYDAAGNVGTSAGVPITVNNDVTPPTTTLTAPAAGAVLSLTATLTANASDDRSVSRVEFYRDGVLIGTDTIAPYSVGWDTTLVANGSYTLTSKAYDPTGNSATSAGVAVTVSNETVPPVTTLTSPAAGSTVSLTVTLMADASDNVGVTKVEFYRDSTLIGTATSAPYSVSWNTRTVANGSYTLTSKAYDAARNTGTSAGVTVTVANDTVAPTTSITSPASGSTVTGTVTITANASDNVGVTLVEFYRGTVLLGMSSAAPYSLSWNTTQSPEGSQTLTTKAYDATGNVGTSAGVTVTVYAPGNAAYDPTLRAPKCAVVGPSCGTLSLVMGRANLKPELNQPNTINGSCADGTSGTYNSDESLEVLRIATTDFTNFAPGKTVRVEADVHPYAGGYASDHLDLYYAANAAAPSWVLIATLTPTSGGYQTLSATYTLPSGGGLQAIRGVFRYGGSAAPCGTGGYDDRDDLIFAVGGGTPDATAPTASITSPSAGATVSGVTTIAANASDNVGVTRVDFYQGSTLIATDTTAPYSVSWSTGTVANGSYTLTAKAYDAAGNVGTSAGVTVTVSNSAGPELIGNGGFEGSVSPWVIAGQSTHVASGSYPHGGAGYNELGNSDNASGTTEQSLTIPSGGAPQLTFWLNVTTTESPSSTTQWDKLFIEVLNPSGTLLGTLGTFSNLDYGTAGVYSQKSYSLASYAGQTIKLRFRATTDGSLPSIFRIDDVSVR